MDMMEVADPDAVHAVRSFIRKQLASELKADFLSLVWPVTRGLILFTFHVSTSWLITGWMIVSYLQVENNRSSEEYVFNYPNMARRALKNIALGPCFLAS